MYQHEKRLDCRALGKEIKRRRKAKGWTQEHLAQIVDLTPRSIMYIENKGQHTSLNAFYKLVTLLDISVDEFSTRTGTTERTSAGNTLIVC